MRRLILSAALVTLTVFAASLHAASLFDLFRPKKGGESLSSLSQEQLISGLKEALAKGAQHAVTNLGKPDGFLKDTSVRTRP